MIQISFKGTVQHLTTKLLRTGQVNKTNIKYTKIRSRTKENQPETRLSNVQHDMLQLFCSLSQMKVQNDYVTNFNYLTHDLGLSDLSTNPDFERIPTFQ